MRTEVTPLCGGHISRPAIGPRVRASILTAAVLAAMFTASSIPDLATDASPAVQLLANFIHVPVFAALTALWLRVFSGSNHPSRLACALAFAASALCATVDEWHQSFVPGRLASAADLSTDLASSAAVLAIVRMRARGARLTSDHP